MAREFEGEKDIRARISEKCPGKEIFGIDDVAKYLNRSRHFVKDNIMPDTRLLYITELAKRLYKISNGKEVV